MSLLTSLLKRNRAPEIPRGNTAIFGDIHSNIEAFNACLADMQQHDVIQFICTGDVVGYGASPAACIQGLRELNALVVKGNHDHYCSGDYIPMDVNPTARETMIWTHNQLSPDEVDWLVELPMTLGYDNIAATHSTFEPERNWPYIQEVADSDISMLLQPKPLGFYGHTHRPTLFTMAPTGVIKQSAFDTVKLPAQGKTFINPGSLGQPRDNDPRASYALYNPFDETVTLRRVDYDIEQAAQKIRDAGLPDRNAERLFVGK